MFFPAWSTTPPSNVVLHPPHPCTQYDSGIACQASFPLPRGVFGIDHSHFHPVCTLRRSPENVHAMLTLGIVNVL